MGEGDDVKGREALREMIAAGKPKEPVAPEGIRLARTSGAVKAMNLGLQRLSDEAAEAQSLRESLASGDQVVEIDPADIDVSFIVDRIVVENDPSFTSLKEKIAEHGQQVPILVRPHPDDPKRFQAAYGHRRLRAASHIGRPVKAIVRTLTDSQLVVAQGQENSERRDLSFIERALFAAHLEERKFDRDTITAALSVDKPELSRLLGVVKSVEKDIILAIGPAPKIGRPRWLLLAEKMNDVVNRHRARQSIATEAFAERESNARFDLLFGRLEAAGKSAKAPIAPKEVAWIERTKIGVRLVSGDRAFGSFLESRLPELLREFEQRSPLTGKKAKGKTGNVDGAAGEIVS
jgi:ParB family transcriptional regulator, chromosome partitioning protein